MVEAYCKQTLRPWGEKAKFLTDEEGAYSCTTKYD